MLLKKFLFTSCALFAAYHVSRPQSSAADQMVPVSPFVLRKADARVEAAPAHQLLRPAEGAARSAPPASPWQLARPKPTAGVPASEDAAPDGIDLSALRYYAAQNDLARVSAEIRQIRVRHPDWQPPDDLFSDAGGSADEQPLWDLFAKGDFASVRDGIAHIQKDKPDWQPSLDLRSKLAEAEARQDWVTASDAKRWDDVLALAAKNTALLTCANTDLLWRTAEALAATGDEPRAMDAYTYILATCRDPQERLATVQKASLVLKSPGTVDALMRQGRTGADGRSEFDPVRAALLRQRVGAAVQAGATPMPADIEALKADWVRTRDADDAEALAWAAFAGKQPAEAEVRFRDAITVAETPKRSEGLALALRDEHRSPDAIKVLMPRVGTDPASAKLLIELVSASMLDPKAAGIAPDVSAAFVAAVEATKAADGAQAYGWHLFKAGQAAAASEWFEKSNTWQANEGAVVGLLVSAKRSKHDAAFRDVVARYAAAYPRIGQLAAAMRRPGPAGNGNRHIAIAALARRAPPRLAAADHVPHTHRAMGVSGGGGWDKGADAIVAAYEGGDYARTLAMLNARRAQGAEPSGLGVIRGWAQFHAGDWEGAKQTFSGLHDSAFVESREGLRVIQEAYTPPRLR